MIEEPGPDPTVDIEINGFDVCTDFVVSAPPIYIGRYRSERELGKGRVGLFYLANDEILERFVAIKVPPSQIIFKAADGVTCLAEARTGAQFDHPNIIPVQDLRNPGIENEVSLSRRLPGLHETGHDRLPSSKDDSES